MSESKLYSIETIFHEGRPLLELRFSGRLDREAIAEVFEIFRRPGFTRHHQLLLDLSGVALDFSIEDVSLVGSAVARSPALRREGRRTAWIIDSHTNAEIVRLGRAFAPRWQTVWKFLNDRESAIAWLEADSEGEVEFGASDFS